jgi:hypothetical protein
LNEFKNEIPVLSDSFYKAEYKEKAESYLEGIDDQFISTRDNDELSKTLINFLSTISNNSKYTPSFSLGGSN